MINYGAEYYIYVCDILVRFGSFESFTVCSDRKHVCHTERLVCIATDRLTDIQISGWSARQIDGQIDNQIDIVRSTHLVMLIQNIFKYTIYTLWDEMSVSYNAFAPSQN